MTRIVMVHGAFNELWGPHEIKARWLPALRDGLWHHGVEVRDEDVGVCFYGDLFRRNPGSERDRRIEASRDGIEEVLRDLAGGDAIAALGQAASDAAFDRTVDMVTIMTTEPDLRARMWARAEPLFDDTTCVVVAHSLGTLLSYRALCHRPELAINTFVTLGSPLASPMILQALDPPLVDGVGQWPAAVERWVNVRAVGDKAAAVPLGPVFGDRVEDVLIDNGHRFHDPEPYLNCVATGAAIAAALG